MESFAVASKDSIPTGYSVEPVKKNPTSLLAFWELLSIF